MQGIGYIITNILVFLLISGALGFGLGWLLRKPGSKSEDRYLSLYQSSERGRKEAEEALETTRQELDAFRAGSPVALSEPDPNLIRQIEQLTAERDELRSSSMSELPDVANLQSEFNALQDRYNQLDERAESLVSELATVKQAAAAIPVPAPVSTGVDPNLVAEMREEIDELRLKVAKTTQLEMQLTGMTQEKDLLEKELIRVRNAGVPLQKDDEEKKALQGQIEKLQREIISMSMSAEASGLTPSGSGADRAELVALQQRVPSLETELKEAAGQRDSLFEKLNELKNQMVGFQIAAEEVPALKAQIAKLQMASPAEAGGSAEATQLRNELQQANAQIEMLKRQTASVGELQSQLEAARTQLATSATESSDSTRLRGELEGALRDLEATRKAASTQLEQLKGEKERLQATLSQVHVDQNELLNLRQDRERTTQELHSLRAQVAAGGTPEAMTELNQVRAERDRLREDRIALSRQRDQMQTALTQAQEQEAVLQNALREMEARPTGPTPEQIAETTRLRDTLTAMQAERSDLMKKVDRAEGMAVESATIIANMESQLSELENQPKVDPELAERAEIMEQHMRRLQQERDELRARAAALESLLGTLHGQRIQLEQQVTALQGQVASLSAAPAPVAPVYVAPTPVEPVYVAPPVVQAPVAEVPTYVPPVQPVYVAPPVVEVSTPVAEVPVYVPPVEPVYVAPPVVEVSTPVAEVPVYVPPVEPVYVAPPVVAEPVYVAPTPVEAPVYVAPPVVEVTPPVVEVEPPVVQVQAPVVEPVYVAPPVVEAPVYVAPPVVDIQPPVVQVQAPVEPVYVAPVEPVYAAPVTPAPISEPTYAAPAVPLFPEEPERVPVPAVTPGEMPLLIDVPIIEGDFTPVFAPEVDEEPIPVEVVIEPEPEPEPVPEPEIVMPGVFAGASLAEPLPAPMPEPVVPAEYVRPKPTESDDLEEIIGIGPVARQVLNDMGITTFKRVALMSQADMDRIAGFLENFRDRVVREKWREQAKVLHRMKYGKDL
jgi:predicted flap endonuclease-1-like 5' DNA nuclease/predicted  nucleic acid-binding Zn-ribbon protein